MEAYKQEFIEFMIDCNVLKFGDFVTKSGRKTPFFVNTGFYRTGAQLRKLGQYYAKAIEGKFGLDFDVLFGPAYKGIPLAVSAVVALSNKFGIDVSYCFDRKEAKDHGADKGGFLGDKLKDGDRVIMIEDVTTSGKSMEETTPKVRGAANVEIKGLIVSLDRNEVGANSNKTALAAMEETFGSTAHGAGRILSRSKAKKDYNADEITEDLESKGIKIKATSNCRRSAWSL